MNFLKINLVVILMLCLVFSLYPEKSKDVSTGKTSKLAVVNGTVINSDELDFEMKRVQQRLRMQGRQVPPQMLGELKKEILKNLVNRELFYQAAKKKGVKIEEKLYKEHIAKLKKNYKTEEQYKKVLENMGITEKELRDQFFKDMTVNLYVQDEIVKNTDVPEKEIRKFYDENKARFKQPEMVKASHILIKVDPKADKKEKAKAKKKIEGILAEINKGGNFAELAKKHSGCPSKNKGGDLGFFKAGQMVKPFEKVAFALKPGKLSDVVETKFGFHIIKTIEKKPAGATPFKDVKENLSKYLVQEKVKEKMMEAAEKLRKRAKIKKF